MFSMASQYIFGHWRYAGKVMGLAPYGDPASFPEPFIELAEPDCATAGDSSTRLRPPSLAR